jgi:hypothetical protein
MYKMKTRTVSFAPLPPSCRRERRLRALFPIFLSWFVVAVACASSSILRLVRH